jgi:hypothetical protein
MLTREDILKYKELDSAIRESAEHILYKYSDIMGDDDIRGYEFIELSDDMIVYDTYWGYYLDLPMYCLYDENWEEKIRNKINKEREEEWEMNQAYKKAEEEKIREEEQVLLKQLKEKYEGDNK